MGSESFSDYFREIAWLLQDLPGGNFPANRKKGEVKDQTYLEIAWFCVGKGISSCRNHDDDDDDYYDDDDYFDDDMQCMMMADDGR